MYNFPCSFRIHERVLFPLCFSVFGFVYAFSKASLYCSSGFRTASRIQVIFLLRLMFASSEKHRQHYYKKDLKISKNPKFESCTLDTVENTATTTSIEQCRPFYVRQYHSSRMGEFNIT